MIHRNPRFGRRIRRPPCGLLGPTVGADNWRPLRGSPQLFGELIARLQGRHALCYPCCPATPGIAAMCAATGLRSVRPGSARGGSYWPIRVVGPPVPPAGVLAPWTTSATVAGGSRANVRVRTVTSVGLGVGPVEGGLRERQVPAVPATAATPGPWCSRVRRWLTSTVHDCSLAVLGAGLGSVGGKP